MSAIENKLVVLTGASAGIGRALALEMAARGARLVLAARDETRLREVEEECRARGAQALAVRADVASRADCERLIERAAAAMGGVDVLLNNAGIGMIGRFDAMRDLQVYEDLMRVNYFGCVYLTHAALPYLKRSRGRLVVVASLAGLTGVPTRTGYAASKHAVVGFFDSLRIELLEDGVSVTIACPDFVVSEIHKRAIGPDGKPLGKSPMQEGRIMTAETCARQIVDAVERRERMLVMSLRGRLGRFVRLIAPGVIDKIAAKAVREGK